MNSDLNIDAIPDELRERDQWICWREEARDGADKPTKVPVDPHTGSYASSTDSDTWGSLADALAAHDDSGKNTDGIGYVFDKKGTIAGVDLDNVRDPETGALEPWAVDVVDELDSWTEVSVSGTGLHVYVVGFKPGDACRKQQESTLEAFDSAELEMYDESRFFVVTGEQLENTPGEIRVRNDELDDIYHGYLRENEPEDENASAESTATPAAELDDGDIVELAKNANNGSEFERLWKGSTTMYDGDHSRARMALLCHLAFYTGGDHQQIDRLFQESGLHPHPEKPGKWERVGDDEISKAIDTVSPEFYEPSNETTPPEAPLRDEGEAPQAEADGGATASASPDTDPTSLGVSPESIKSVLMLGEDDSINDLTDREKAAATWEVIDNTNEVHVRVRRDTDTIWGFENGVWNRDGVRQLRHTAKRALGATNYGNNTLSELKAQVKASPHAEIEGTQLGVKPGTIAVENGLLDLDAAAERDDDALRRLKPTDYAIRQLPVKYDPEATYEEWQQYVEEWAEQGRADALQEYVGYCLHVNEMPVHRALLLVGSGANGKGTFLHVVRQLLGEDNTTSIELQTLANERDALAEFYGAIANIDDDLSARKLGAGLGMFKKLVGGDNVRARHLYEDGFEFEATGKHLYAANEVPDVDIPDDDEAFWRRWLLVEFPNHYPPSERDSDLRHRLSTDEALSGVLNWAIDGWKRLREQGYFTNEERYAAQKRSRWQSWGDSADKFIEECLERDEDADNVSTQQVHQRYSAWCRANNYEIIGQQKLTNTLKKENYDYGRKKVDGSSTRAFGALSFSEDVPDLDETPDRDTEQTSL